MNKYKSARSLYNNIYKKYHDNRSKASNDLTELPTVLKLLGDLEGKKLLDVGCGFGKHAKEFIKRGAIVTGIDASEKMIALTKAYCKDKGEFFRADYGTNLFNPNSFDVINGSLSLNYASDPEKVFGNIAKWLRKNGIFTFSIPHPVWLLSRVENMDYSKAHKIWIHMGSYDIDVFNYYQPLNTYIQLFNKHNLRLLDMVETVTSKRYKGLKEEKYRLPNVIVFKLQKS